jgi:hypothetical protein
VLKGISTGEGLVWEVHDDIYKMIMDKKSSKPELTLVEPNVTDKRLLIILSEFQQCLANMRRTDSILPSVLRQGWDKGDLSTPAKNSRAIATGALISMVSAISRAELLHEVEAADAESGMLNRFNFVCSRRSKLLPQGGGFSKLFQSDEWVDLQERFTHNIQTPNGPVLMERNRGAEETWGLNNAPGNGMYKDLNQPRAGMWGAVTARAAQMVLRIALITAAINGEREITSEHLHCGYECWRYCDESARYVFGDRLDNPTAAEIMKNLRGKTPAGMSRSEVYRIWNGKKNRIEIDGALLLLSHNGIARCEKADTNGRPAEMWYECV